MKLAGTYKNCNSISFYPQFTSFLYPLAHLTLAHHARNVSLRNFRRLIDSTIFQATRPVTNKEGENTKIKRRVEV